MRRVGRTQNVNGSRSFVWCSWKQCTEKHNKAYETESKVHVSVRKTTVSCVYSKNGAWQPLYETWCRQLFPAHTCLSTSSQPEDFLYGSLTVSTEATRSVMLDLFVCCANSYTHASHKHDTFLFCVQIHALCAHKISLPSVGSSPPPPRLSNAANRTKQNSQFPANLRSPVLCPWRIFVLCINDYGTHCMFTALFSHITVSGSHDSFV